MDLTDFQFSGYNYKLEKIYCRQVGTKVFDTEETALAYLQDEKPDGWSAYERDGKIHMSLLESKHVPLEEGELIDLADMVSYVLIMKDPRVDDTIFELQYIECVDEYIEDLLIKINERGLFTFSSCSGLVEDHLRYFPFVEISEPFIMFLNVDYKERLEDLIDGTSWKLEVRDSSVVISNSVDGDLTVRKAWEELEKRIIS